MYLSPNRGKLFLPRICRKRSALHFCLYDSGKWQETCIPVVRHARRETWQIADYLHLLVWWQQYFGRIESVLAVWCTPLEGDLPWQMEPPFCWAQLCSSGLPGLAWALLLPSSTGRCCESPIHPLHVSVCPPLIATTDLWSFLLQESNTRAS